MGTISVSLPADGTTADVADVNTPITTIVNEFNGNIDDANIKSGAAIAPAKIAGGSSGMLSSWATWTPSWTNLTTGNGTLTYASYIQVGKTVVARFKFVLGSTSSASGTIAMSLPVTSASYAASFTTIGRGVFYDSSGSVYQPFDVSLESTTTVSFLMNNASATYVAWNYLSNSVPAAPATNDFIQGFIVYEAA